MSDAIPLELRDELAAPNVRRAIDPRSIPVRFSRLRRMAQSPRHYLHAAQGDDGDTLARRLGRGTHAVVLGTPVVCWDQVTDSGRARPRNGKDWDAFCLDNPGAEILNLKEYAQAVAQAESIKRHKRASELIYGAGTLLEHELSWRYLGRDCSSHLDVYRPGQYVADIKCARDASPERFARSAIWSHYHSQLAFYCAAAKSLGQSVSAAYLIVVENVPPYDVTVRPLTDAALDDGDRLWREWFGKLLACERAGTWPGYAESDLPIDALNNDTAGLGLMFGGESFDL